MKEIKLTQGKFALVDDDMFDILNKHKWHTINQKRWGLFYVKRGFSPGRQAFMHWYIIGHPRKGFVVDHIDGNGLNNQRENLRVVPISQNNANNKIRREGRTKSKYVGVTFLKGRWRTRAQIDGEVYWLGSFKTEEDAGNAYIEFKRKTSNV